MKLWHRVKNIFIPSEHNVYRPHLLSKPALLFFLTIVLTAEGVFIADLLARHSALNYLSAVLAGEVVAFTNTERIHNGVMDLTENELLTAAAQAKAEDMAAKGYFSHNGPDGKEPWVWVREAGYAYQYAGENLAVRFTDSRDVVEAWMASPSHKANIVKPAYTHIGVGVARGEFDGSPATFVVQYFGAPQGAAAVLGVETSDTEGGVPRAEPAGGVAVAGQAQVEGAAVVVQAIEPALQPALSAEALFSIQQAQSPWSSFARELVRGDVASSPVVLWILGAVATLLIIGLALAFFVHMQVQANDMLMGGAVVAVIALSFIALNMHTPFTTERSSAQTAAVFGALPQSGGFIDSHAVSVVAQ